MSYALTTLQGLIFKQVAVIPSHLRLKQAALLHDGIILHRSGLGPPDLLGGNMATRPLLARLAAASDEERYFLENSEEFADFCQDTDALDDGGEALFEFLGESAEGKRWYEVAHQAALQDSTEATQNEPDQQHEDFLDRLAVYGYDLPLYGAGLSFLHDVQPMMTSVHCRLMGIPSAPDSRSMQVACVETPRLEKLTWAEILTLRERPDWASFRAFAGRAEQRLAAGQLPLDAFLAELVEVGTGMERIAKPSSLPVFASVLPVDQIPGVGLALSGVLSPIAALCENRRKRSLHKKHGWFFFWSDLHQRLG
jgi:hypothetical protein